MCEGFAYEVGLPLKISLKFRKDDVTINPINFVIKNTN